MRRAQRPSCPTEHSVFQNPTQVNDSARKIGVMLTAAKEGTFSASSDPCVLFPLAASSRVYPKTRVWGSSEKMLHCFSATAPLSGNSRRGCEESSGKTTVGSALDNNGNTLTKVTGSNTTTYAWDFENRLKSVTLPGTGGTVTFKYDPFGRRIYKSSTSSTSIYAYDGDNLIEEINSSGAAVARYSQTIEVDEPLAMLRSGTTSYYDADGLGSITSLSNGAGALAQTYAFDSFGKQTASSGSLANPFQYTSREFDGETNLLYFRARYYDPQTGRFISEDPIRFDSGQNDFFVYVGNHSTDLVDPSGLLQVCCRPAHNGPAEKYAEKTLGPPPCHCFLKLSGGHTLGGYHNNKMWQGSWGGLDLRADDTTDYKKYAKEATCTEIPGDCQKDDQRARDAFGSAPKNLGGYGFAQDDYGTSNDAAARLLKDAGIGYTLPDCAWGKTTGKIPHPHVFGRRPTGPDLP
jgi:RHS repeat-associated protein